MTTLELICVILGVLALGAVMFLAVEALIERGTRL